MGMAERLRKAAALRTSGQQFLSAITKSQGQAKDWDESHMEYSRSSCAQCYLRASGLKRLLTHLPSFIFLALSSFSSLPFLVKGLL